MAAFQFPPTPFDLQTVENPITGSTYQWRADLTKWVLTRQAQTQVGDIIWEGDNPPDPIGDYKLWYSTDTLELYFHYCDANAVCAWVPTSAPITMLEDLDEGLFEVRQLLNQVNSAAITNENDIILIRESLGKVNLEEVLDNGNIADKSIVLTNAENDALLLSPEEARIMVGGVGESVVPRLELRHQTGILETSIVKLELDEDGKRFDIECDEKVDNIHFRFANDDKLVLNKKGDAAFTGRVQVEPGIEGNEAVTYNQLILLEEQIEELAPSFERGRWEFTLEYPPGFGEYTMIKEGLDEDAQEELCTQAFAECQLANQDDPVALADCTRDFNTCMDSINGTKYLTTEHWFESTRIVFSSKDKNGVTHRWNDIAPGLYIEVFNIDGTGGMVSEITKKNYQGDIFHMADRGIGQANGLAAVKIYTLNTSENLELEPTPTPFTWIFKKTSSLPESGEMTCSTEAPGQGSFIKLSHTTSNNIHFSRRRSMLYFSSPQNLPLITIWDKVDAGYRHKLSASVSKIEQDAEGNFVIKLGSINSADNHNITAGGTQWVTVGGFF